MKLKILLFLFFSQVFVSAQIDSADLYPQIKSKIKFPTLKIDHLYLEQSKTKIDTKLKIQKTLILNKFYSNGFLVSVFLTQHWDGSSWINERKYSYTYDSNNNKTVYISQNWDGSNWVNYYKISYTYDSNNNKTVSIPQKWDGSNWVINYKISYTYDSNNNQTEYIFQSWNGSNWINERKYSYTYDSNNNQTEYIFQSWNGSNWVNYSKDSYSYDSSNNNTEFLYQNWDGSNWVNYSKDSYSYDSNNNRTEHITQRWNGSSWINERKYSLTYIPAVDINEEDKVTPTDFTLYQNYPNPFNPGTVISYQLSALSFVTIKVFDLLGREITTLVNEEKPAGTYEVKFNANNLPSGIYFYTIKAGSFYQTKKMVLLK